jgi:hypothetical protein
MKITWESRLLTVICMADLITTIWFVRQGGASEANPMMRFYLERGIVPFVLAKMALFLGPLVILEWARRRRPRFVRTMMRMAIVLYICLYGTVVWRINRTRVTEPSPASLIAEQHWVAAAVTHQELAMLRKERGLISDQRLVWRPQGLVR